MSFDGKFEVNDEAGGQGVAYIGWWGFEIGGSMRSRWSMRIASESEGRAWEACALLNGER